MGGILSAKAYINHGRWVVDCPRCNGGVKVSEQEAGCPDCGAELAVGWPDQADRDAAEEVLAVRPTENRNWYPATEDVDDLKAENLLHGLVV